MERGISEEAVTAKAACCNGWFPNWKCCSVGKRAKKMTVAFDHPLGEDLETYLEFQPINGADQIGTNYHEGSSSSGTSNHIQQPIDRRRIEFESRRSTMGGVMEALRGNQINPVVICGMAGIGKTTLMGQVFEQAKKEGLFDEYTKATFKESLDVIQIQGELAEYLGLPLEGNAKDARASKLRQRLSQGSKKILVMLDNAWTTTPDLLWDIGIPPSCQLLVTSRQQDVFKDMDRRKTFPIDGLPERDAWRLFEKTAGSCFESDHEFRVVAEKILKKCGGLPIAISTVGTALQGESIAIWKNAQGELEKANPENVDGVIEHVYGPIKFSYESLPGEEAKSCFLLCCIFEGSAGIRIDDLVRYALGLGLFKGTDSMVKGRNRVETLVQKLKSRFLLFDTDDPELVRMHDVVRDAGMYLGSPEFANRIVVRDTVKTLNLMHWPRDIFLAQSTCCSSLSNSGLCELLLLRGIGGGALEPFPTIFKRMEGLKVLSIEHMSLSSLAVLRNLQTLRLEGCFLEFDVSVIGKLRTLKTLSLRGSDIKQLPDTFRNLSNLRLLDLSECTDLKIVSPGVISSLSRLEELYMWASFQDWVVEKLASTETINWNSQLEAGPGEVDNWKKITKSANLEEYEQRTRWANSMDWTTGILAELLSLSCLTTLEVVLPPVNVLLTSMLFNKLKRFKICIGWEMKSARKLEPRENYLRVSDIDAGSFVGSRIISLLEKTNSLELSMKNFTVPLNVVFDKVSFSKLKNLEVRDYDGEYLIDVTLMTPSLSKSFFPVLNFLSITGARKLKEISNGELPMGNSTKLRLCLCDLSALICLPSLPVLENLELSLENCSLNFDIVSAIGELRTLRILCLSGSDVKQLPDTFTNLYNLRVLDLSGCLELKIISPGIISSLFGLEELHMWHSFHHWAVEDCILAELFSLFGFPALEVVLPTANSYILLSNKLARFTMSVGANYLRVDDLKESFLVGSGITLLLKKCNSLELNLAEPPNGLVEECCFGNLTSLVLKDTDALEYLVDMTLVKPDPCSSMFPFLISLEIKGASRLKEIFHGELPMGSLKKLRNLVLDSLPVLTCIWKIETKSECFLDILRTVKVLKIQDCMSLEEIVALEGFEQHEEAGKEINFQSLRELTLSNLPSFTGISKNIIEKRTKLETSSNPCSSSIAVCKEIEEAATNENLEKSVIPYLLFDNKVSFPRLKRLTINGLPKLTTIWHKQLAPFSFSRLRDIMVQQCNSLKSECFGDILRTVKVLRIQNCSSLEEIITLEGLEHQEGEAGKEINFQSLTELTLSNLPSLTGISKNIMDKRTKSETSISNPWSSSTASCKEIEETSKMENLDTSDVPYFLFDEKVWFPRLERLTIDGLPKLTTIWHTQLAPNSFSRLRDIMVQQCKSLRSIFPDTIIAAAFQRLQKLTVEHCGVEKIVTREEGLKKSMHDDFFPKLECLELRSLFQLTIFYPGMPAAFSWPQLKTLVLFDCQKVDIFAADLQKTRDSGSSCTAIIKPPVRFDKSSFPRLEELTLVPVDIYGRLVSAMSCEKVFFHAEGEFTSLLRRLRLHGMEKLLRVCKNARPAEPFSPQLEILELEFCGLNNLELSALSFQNLTILQVTFCWRLQYLITYTVAKSLVHLQKMKVDECKSMMQVIAGEDASNCEVVFPRLQYLELSDLISLERFCSRNCTVKVPHLVTSALEVNWCPIKLKISDDGILEEDFSDMHLLEKSHSRKEEALDSTEISMMTEPVEAVNVNQMKIVTNVGKQLSSKQVDGVQINSWLQSLSKLDADRSRLQEELRVIEAERIETEKKLADATGDPSSKFTNNRSLDISHQV